MLGTGSGLCGGAELEAPKQAVPLPCGTHWGPGQWVLLWNVLGPLPAFSSACR